MKNEEKYKTPEERRDAFSAFCNQYDTCRDCHLFTIKRCAGRDGCAFDWLEMEAENENKPLPCPFCGGKAVSYRAGFVKPHVQCSVCGIAMYGNTCDESIAAWNRRANNE